jgi:putative transposase
MAQSLSKILIHTVFSTKERQPFLADRELRDETHRYLGGILNSLECQSLAVGGVADHVHLLSTLARTCTAADMVKEVKRVSSAWLKKKSKSLEQFAWQTGYGVFSIGESQVPAVKRYIANQDEHHRRASFQDEFREMLMLYGVEFDERYVWE